MKDHHAMVTFVSASQRLQMQKTKTNRLRSFLKLILWVVVVQLVLVNITAAIYAHKFTHFYKGDPPAYVAKKDIFTRTWKIFSGPKFYKQNIKERPSFDFQSVRLRTEDDNTIDAWYGETDSSKGCVIFLHGITVNKAVLLDEATDILQMGYNVLLIDFRGHGNSTGLNTTLGYKETKEVEAAFNFARSVKAPNIILYGSSMGAVVAMKAVSDGLVQPNGIIADMPFDALQDHLEAKARIVGFPPQPFAFLVTTWISVLRGYNGFAHKASNYAEEITCPVLLQWGAQDVYVQKKETEHIYNALPSDRKKLVVYEDADHESFFRKDPVKWRSEVEGFLSSL